MRAGWRDESGSMRAGETSPSWEAAGVEQQHARQKTAGAALAQAAAPGAAGALHTGRLLQRPLQRPLRRG